MNDKMSKSWQRGFNVARKASMLSNSPSYGELMGAALYAGSILLASESNIWFKTSPHSKMKEYQGYTHAEISALLKIKHYEKSKNLILYVSRTITNPEQTIAKFGCSRPCINCMNLISEYGVRRVRFFDESGVPVEIKF